MLINKCFISLGIFISMFVGSWWLNEVNERNIYRQQQLEEGKTIGILEENPSFLQFEPFRPREYIRIDTVTP